MPVKLNIDIFILHINHLRDAEKPFVKYYANISIPYDEIGQKIDIIDQAIRDLSKK